MKDEKLLEEAEKRVKGLEAEEAIACRYTIEENMNQEKPNNEVYLKEVREKDIKSSYNFLLLYGRIMKVLLFVVAGLYVATFLLSIDSENVATVGAVITMVSLVIGLIVAGLFLEAIMKWFAYMLLNVHEINMKIK